MKTWKQGLLATAMTLARAATAGSWASLTPTRSLGKPPTVSRVKTFPYANGCGKSPFIASNLMVTDSPSEGVDRLACLPGQWAGSSSAAHSKESLRLSNENQNLSPPRGNTGGNRPPREVFPL